MRDINFIEIIDELNEHIFERDEYSDVCFSYSTNGYVDFIKFEGVTLWHSEDDDREWIEEESDYEPFLPFIKKKFNSQIGEFQKLKF